MDVQAVLEGLRARVQQCIKENALEDAAFLADKAVTLSTGSMRDVYWLARVLHQQGEHARALHMLRSRRLDQTNMSCRLLAAQCLHGCKDYEGVLDTIGRGSDDLQNILSSVYSDGRISSNSAPVAMQKSAAAKPGALPSTPSSLHMQGMSTPARKAAGLPGQGGAGEVEASTRSSTAGDGQQGAKESKGESVDKVAPLTDDSFQPVHNVMTSLCLLRGTVLEFVDKRDAAVDAYHEALLHDPLNTQAFRKLMGGRLLTVEREAEVYSQVKAKLQEMSEAGTISSDDVEMIVSLYNCHLVKDRADTSDLPVHESMADNADVRLAQASRLYFQARFRHAYLHTSAILDQDPFHTECLPLHIACLVELRDINGLFYLAHKLVNDYPKKAVAWFAVGSYYYVVDRHDHGRRHFWKGTQLDSSFGPAWMGLGHAFAAEGEHDQAMAAYCAAARVLAGSHLPMLYIAVEYTQTNNLNLAMQHLRRAKELCDYDPQVFHEMGVVYFRRGKLDDAESAFRRSLKLADATDMTTGRQREATLCNLGRCLYEKAKYEEAVDTFQLAIASNTTNAENYLGLAFCLHRLQRYDEAIEAYHKALGIDPNHVVADQMLKNALQDHLEFVKAVP